MCFAILVFVADVNMPDVYYQIMAKKGYLHKRCNIIWTYQLIQYYYESSK